jgi:hypothetical protein
MQNMANPITRTSSATTVERRGIWRRIVGQRVEERRGRDRRVGRRRKEEVIRRIRRIK